jgi:hypothetical protein
MSDSKKIVWAAVGVAALIGGALLFHSFSNKESSSSQCLDEIDQLGAPQKDPNGLLAFPYYKNMFMIISKHCKNKFASEKKDYVIKRRKALRDKNERDYREIVKELVQKEEASFGDMLSEAMEHIGITEQEFMHMHQMYMSNPQTQQVLMQAQMMPAGDGAPPAITKSKTREIFLYSEERKMESLKTMMSSGGMGGPGYDQMEGMVDMMIEQSKLSDEMWEKYQIEEEDFNAAMIHYNLMNDPEI